MKKNNRLIEAKIFHIHFKKLLLSLLFLSIGYNFSNLLSQSVYICNATNVNIRANQCQTSTTFGQISNPHSYVVTNSIQSNCGDGLNWYQIDIPNANGQPGYPSTAYVASNFFTISNNPTNFLTVQNSPNGLQVRNSINGSNTWIINTGFSPNFASFGNSQKLARTPSAPVADPNGVDTWYEIYLTPNCYNGNNPSSGVKLQGWVSNGISSGGPFITFPNSTCNYSISPTNITSNSLGGNGSIFVSTTAGCAWTAISNNTSWLNVTSGGSGSGNGLVNYSFDSNPNNTLRTGTLTIAGLTFTVNQEGNQNNCIICDTKAWNTPFGDCQSGHTNADMVEWPSANLEIQQGQGFLPEDLQINPTVHANDVLPRLINNATCNISLASSYADIIQNINGFQIVSRTWKVTMFNLDDFSIQNKEYLQTIRILNNNCVVPTLQASNVTFSNVTPKQMSIGWNNGNGSRRVVKINTTNSFTPVSNGTSPSANNVYTGKGEQVIYNGTSSNVTVSGLTENTTYWIRVYESNCTGSNSFYSNNSASLNPANRSTPLNPISGNLTNSGNLDFGVVPIGSFNDKSIILYNNTEAPIRVTNISYSLGGNIFRNGFQQNGDIILPGKSLPISIFFTPPGLNIYNTSVTINTTTPGISTTFTARGSGANNQPNWLGVYNELENNPELSNMNQRFRLAENSLNGQPLTPIKICADGSKATVFKFINNNPNFNTRDIIFRIKSDHNATNPDFRGIFLSNDYVFSTTDEKIVDVRFSHPKYLNISGLSRNDIIEIVNKKNGNVLHEIPIEIYRAPVLFVHGLWGNVTNLNSLKNKLLNSGKYELKQLQLVDYKNTNASSFRENANVIKNEINSKLNQLRFALYSAGKVDIVAHSMGGILSRLYLQNDVCKNGQKDDCYRIDINKLITLNTPHSGTQAANYLLNQSNKCAVFNSYILKQTDKPINKGAVADLSCKSTAITSDLNGIKLNKNTVHIHTIVTTAFHNKLYKLGTDESLLVNSISLCRINDNRESFLNKLFNNKDSDFIVPDLSQRGGLLDYTLFFDLLHTKSHQDLSVQNRVLLLLEENPSTSTFFDDNRNGFNPPVLEPTLYDSPDDRTISGERSNLFIDILSPPDNSTYNVGEIVNIALNAAPQYENVTLFISNGNGGSKLVELYNSKTYTLPLDIDLTGTVGINALITDSEGNFEIDSVTINVLPNQQFDSLSFINDEINIPLGQTFSLSVAGFLNTEVFEMNRFPQTEYFVDDTTIVKIKEPGLIEALKLGTTFIKASFQGLEAYVKINVYEGYDWVYAANCIVPTSPSSAISFSFVSTQQFTVTWANGNGSRRVVKINTLNQFTPPSNGTDPAANSLYSGFGEQVIYNGTGNSVTVTGLKPNTTYWVRVYEANCEGIYSLYNTSVASQNPNSQQTVLVPPYIQSFTGSTVLPVPGGGTSREVFYNNTNVYGVNPPVVVTADGSANTVFTLKASFITGMGFRIVNKQGKVVTNGDIATDPARYGRLGVKQILSHNTMEMTYTHPQLIDEAVLPLRIQLLYHEGLLGLTIPLHLVAAAPLPVELSDFNAYHDKVNHHNKVTWSTQTERNNSHFVLLRSFQNESFQAIGKIDGAGNSDLPVDYLYLDKDIHQTGTYFYQLEQVDFDGRQTYSDVVQVSIKHASGITTSIYPNPTNGLIYCKVDGSFESFSLTLYDLLGNKLTETQSLTKEESGNTPYLSCEHLAGGVYQVVISVDGEVFQHKVVLIK